MTHVPLRHTILLAVLLAGCTGAGSGATAPAETAGPAVPANGVRKIDAAELHRIASQTDGRARLVNFWATWCGPCVEELPQIAAFSAAHPEVDVVLVNLDYPTLTQSHVVPFIKRHHLDGLQIVQLDDPDPATAVARAVQGWPYTIPFTLLLDATGRRQAAWTRGITRDDVERAVGQADRGEE